MKRFNRLLWTGLVCIAWTASGAHASITISVADVNFGFQNLSVTTLGATTANTILIGNYLVGPRGVAGQWERPIVPFLRSSFASIAGLSLTSATLKYNIVTDFTESGESYLSEVRLFTTNQTSLTLANRNVFAALTGDGGAHTVVGTASLVDGVTGAQSLSFSAAALTGLYNAINGTDVTIGIAFREFAGNDILDEFVFGVPPGVMRIEVTAVPVPGTLALLGLAGLVGTRRRRR